MKTKAIQTKLICTRCGNIQIIQRKASKKKRFGHLKYLYCWKCRKRVNHFEICGEEIEEINEI